MSNNKIMPRRNLVAEHTIITQKGTYASLVDLLTKNICSLRVQRFCIMPGRCVVLFTGIFAVASLQSG